ncbi:hypothetical protein [Tropicimonas aquimaris]|uniref:Uncharacterized protein n=1 Tax=Tropicimonas aquimaris TaxID=914152 RepID=A0ABW3IX42_9RHOB
MFKRLFSTFEATGATAGEPSRPGRMAPLRQSYDDWRFERDFTAVMTALDRLSDRQLHLIGLTRGSLFDAVEEMILDTAQQRALGREVIELLEGSQRDAITAEEDGSRKFEQPQGLRAA